MEPHTLVRWKLLLGESYTQNVELTSAPKQTGAAYLYLDPEKGPNYDKIKIIKSWPGGGGGNDTRNLDKAPTEISFESGKTLWGFEIPSGTTRYSCFKLLLDEKASERTYDDPSLAAGVNSGVRPSLPDGKTVHDVTFEYLRLLYSHVMNELRDHSPSTLDVTPIHFILTVPAIWSHAAQRATLDAAKRAQFGSRNGDKITMVSEPEAAGAYCLREMQQGGVNKLKVYTYKYIYLPTLSCHNHRNPVDSGLVIGWGAYLDM